MTDMRVEPLTDARFGARITGVDPSVIDADEMNALTAVFGENEFAPGMITGYGRDER